LRYSYIFHYAAETAEAAAEAATTNWEIAEAAAEAATTNWEIAEAAAEAATTNWAAPMIKIGRVIGVAVTNSE
jgi:hypothetical protein